MPSVDPYDLQRFLDAQAGVYAAVLEELRGGRKRSHWIWYVFPQVAGLGRSPMSRKYAIRSREEAAGYLAHEVLGSRLRACASAILLHKGKDIREIMGSPDDMKLRSSMTLFDAVDGGGGLFDRVLRAFYAGARDRRTLDFLGKDGVEHVAEPPA